MDWAGRSPPAVLDREGELAHIAAAAELARRGRVAVIVISGVAGIGKTALLENACALFEQGGARVLHARCSPFETDNPFGVVRALIEPVLRESSERRRRVLFRGAAALARAVLWPPDAHTARVVNPLAHRPSHPHLGTQASADGSTTGTEASVDSPLDAHVALHGLYWLVTNLAAGHRLVLAVDDLHWADEPSARFAAYLTRRLTGTGVSVVVTTREPVAGPAGPHVSELLAEPGVLHLRPAALTTATIASIITQRLGQEPDTPFTEACASATGGVPFLLHTLLGALAAAGVRPVAGAAASLSRFGWEAVASDVTQRLSPHPIAQRVAEACVVLGEEATASMTARFTDLSDADLRSAVEVLAGLNILTGTWPLRFVHPIVQAAVYRRLSPTRRPAEHARAADLLRAHGASPERIAGHLLKSPSSGRADVVDALLQAAERAVRAGSPQSAVPLLERGLDEGVHERTLDLLFALGRAQASTHDLAAADTLRRGLAEAVDPVTRGRFALALAQIFVTTGQWGAALNLIAPALADLDAAAPDPARDELIVRLKTYRLGFASYDPHLSASWSDWYADLRGHVAPRAVRTPTIAARGAPARNAAALLIGVATTRIADIGMSEKEIDAELVNCELDVTSIETPIVGQLAYALAGRERIDDLERLGSTLQRIGREQGRVYDTAVGETMIGFARVQAGDLVQAETCLRAAFDLARRHQILFALPSILSWSSEVLVERPGLDEITDVALGLELDDRFTGTMSGAMVLEAQGLILLSRGASREGINRLRRAGRTYEDCHCTAPVLFPWRIRLADAIGGADVTAARELARAHLELGRRSGQPRAVGVAQCALGRLAGGNAGIDLLTGAVAILEATPARLDLARALLELGAALRRGNHRAQARAPLRRALELAVRAGAPRTAERARVELAATGIRVAPAKALTGAAALTPSQRRVAELAAAGMSNPEIAQALFITRNTVETHLRSVYLRLGVSGRGALSGRL